MAFLVFLVQCFAHLAVITTAQISWQSSNNAYWALSCDFAGNDIGSARVTSDMCSTACGSRSGCTHFSWSRYEDGTCWFKSLRGITQANAITSGKPGIVCGVMKRATPTRPVPPPRQPTWDPRQFTPEYLPIFRFDGDAGRYCFPDDKRKFAERNNKCNNRFNRRAPVFYSHRVCGAYNVYQYNLWYGLQKGCVIQWISFDGERHDDDNEYVQVWVRNGNVEKVRYNQHNGYYFRNVGDGAEMKGKRPVIYIGKKAHGAYHRGCTGNPFRGGTRKCLGFSGFSCMYWEDYRNPDGRYDLDRGTLIEDPSPRDIDCNPGECRKGHSYSRKPKDSSCYGVKN